MRLILVLLVVTAVFMTSCSGNKNGQSDADVVADSLTADSLNADSLAVDLENLPMPKAADELFDDFLQLCAEEEMWEFTVHLPADIPIGMHTLKAFFCHDEGEIIEKIKNDTLQASFAISQLYPFRTREAITFCRRLYRSESGFALAFKEVVPDSFDRICVIIPELVLIFRTIGRLG